MAGNESSEVSFRQNKLVNVEYPGYVENVQHMLQSLGGEEAVSRTNEGNPARLELVFRPDDPYCHPMCGDRFPTSNLLLRVKKKRKKKKKDKAEIDEVKYEQEILGIVDTTYRFESLADFQYLAPDMPEILKEIAGTELLNHKIPLHVPPAAFTRFDRPVEYKYKPEPQSKRGCLAQKGEDLDPERLAGTRLRNRRPAFAFAASLDTKQVPTAPHAKAVELARKQNDNWDVELKKLFDRRPMWSRMALLSHMNCSQDRLRQLLPTVGYYWLNGPWRTLWTKFGYDPRNDPSAKIYQMLDFRMSKNKQAQEQIKMKRSSLPYGLPQYRRKVPTVTGITDPTNVEKNRDLTQAEEEDDLPYVFQTNKLPVHQHIMYQLCDIHDSEIQAIVAANDGEETECNDRDGWCLPGTHDQIRKILVKKTLELIDKRKMEQAREETSSVTSSENIEAWGGEMWGGFDDTTSFLEMLQNDDDVEAYDIFEEEQMDVEDAV